MLCNIIFAFCTSTTSTPTPEPKILFSDYRIIFSRSATQQFVIGSWNASHAETWLKIKPCCLCMSHGIHTNWISIGLSAPPPFACPPASLCPPALLCLVSSRVASSSPCPPPSHFLPLPALPLPLTLLSVLGSRSHFDWVC